MFNDNIATLLERAGIPPSKGTKLYAIVVSFRILARTERLPAMLSDFLRLGDRLRTLLGSAITQISETEFVLLAEQTEYSALGAVADLKMLLLKLVGRHDAQAFGAVDQSRFVRVFELPRQQAEFVSLLYEERNRPQPAASARTLRALSPSDIPTITAVLDGMSRHDLVDKFIRSQPIAVVKKGQFPAVALSEYFVSMSMLQQHIVPGANLLLHRPTFSLLAHELDQRVIECLLKKTIDSRFASFNFNLDTIFTRRFDELTASGLARNLIVELRISDIFENFDKFLIARKMLRAASIRLAIDGVQLSMLSAVRPERLECEFVKVQADDSFDTGSRTMAEASELVRSGSRLILCRVENLETLRTGMEMGFEVFQGFYIDALLKDTAERDRFLIAA